MTTSIHDTRHAAELAQRGAVLLSAAAELSPSARGEAIDVGAAFLLDALKWAGTAKPMAVLDLESLDGLLDLAARLEKSNFPPSVASAIRRFARESQAECLRLRGWLDHIAPTVIAGADAGTRGCYGMDNCGCFICQVGAALAGDPVPS